MHTLNIRTFIVVVRECIQDGSTLVIVRHCRERSKSSASSTEVGISTKRKAEKETPRYTGKVKATPLSIRRGRKKSTEKPDAEEQEALHSSKLQPQWKAEEHEDQLQFSDASA
jgi:hypothetical protein